MPTREQVWEAASAVRDSGGRVNQKTVLTKLRDRGIKGTERTIAENFTAWKLAERYEPRREQREMPRHLTDIHAGFVTRIWDAAVAEATGRFENRRLRLEIEREALGQLLDETHVRAEETDRENAALWARQGEMDVELAELRKEVAHLRKTEFWDRVIREIVEFLPEREWMTTAEIARRVPSSLAKEALVRDKALTPGRIHRQMRIRDTHGRFYELNEGDDGPRYRRRPGWTGMTPSPSPHRKSRSE